MIFSDCAKRKRAERFIVYFDVRDGRYKIALPILFIARIYLVM